MYRVLLGAVLLALGACAQVTPINTGAAQESTTAAQTTPQAQTTKVSLADYILSTLEAGGEAAALADACGMDADATTAKVFRLVELIAPDTLPTTKDAFKAARAKKKAALDQEISDGRRCSQNNRKEVREFNEVIDASITNFEADYIYVARSGSVWGLAVGEARACVAAQKVGVSNLVLADASVVERSFLRATQLLPEGERPVALAAYTHEYDKGKALAQSAIPEDCARARDALHTFVQEQALVSITR